MNYANELHRIKFLLPEILSEIVRLMYFQHIGTFKAPLLQFQLYGKCFHRMQNVTSKANKLYVTMSEILQILHVN